MKDGIGSIRCGTVRTVMDNRTLGKRLRRLREAHGISQVAMADRMGFSRSPSMISKIEAGNRKLSAVEFARWCAICNSSTDAVIAGEPITVPITEASA